jgi:hypothetical protein
MAAGIDESGLEVSCNMAQFENPRGNRTAARNVSRDVVPSEPSKEFPDTLSQSPLPVDPTQPDR